MTGAARPPEGDWLGSPYLRFERRAPFAQVTVDRPQARNALTQAMYFGLRYAVRRVDADPDLAGLLIALCADLAVASERATFRVPELLRGISDTYYAQLLVRLVGPVRTRDLMFTGRRLSAAEALDWGLVSRVVPHGELAAAAAGALTEIAQTAPGARRDIKRVVDQVPGPLRRDSRT